MKITLNTYTGCLVIKAMELTGNSISGVIREALFLYIQHVSTKTRVVDEKTNLNIPTKV